MTTSDRNPIGRGFAVLYWMASQPRADFSVTEVALGVDMLASTAHRVLGLLENEALVQQSGNRGRYSLGPSFHRLARAAAVRFSIKDVAQPHVDAIRAATGETAWFATLNTRNSTMTFRCSAESLHVLRVVRPLDEETSLFRAGASGHVGLAYLGEKDRARLLKGPDAASMVDQCPDIAALQEHLQTIRRQGFEISRSSTTGGMGIAVAVRSSDDGLLGVLGIGLPASRCTAEKEQSMLASLVEHATALAREM